MTERYTIETLQSGQPRAYADTVHVVRVTFEWTGAFANEPLGPNWMSEEAARNRLKTLPCGFMDTKRADAGFLGNYLEYLRPVDPKTAKEVVAEQRFPLYAPDAILASTWEFKVVSPFTD
jgi:hypothetical protein